MMNLSQKSVVKHAVKLLVVGCISAFSVTAFAASERQLTAGNQKITGTIDICMVAYEGCLLEVSSSSSPQYLYSITQNCGDVRSLYLYELPLKDQVSNNRYLGTKFCSGVVSSSDMHLPFSTHSPYGSKNHGIQDANDGRLLADEIEHGLKDVSTMLTRMKLLAIEATDDTYSSTRLSDLNTEFTELLSEVNRIAIVNNFNGAALLDGSIPYVNVPVDNGTKKIHLAFSNMTTGSAGLAISSLSVDTNAHAQSAILSLNTAFNTVVNAQKNNEKSQTHLQEAANRDATITSIDLSGKEIVVKKEKPAK